LTDEKGRIAIGTTGDDGSSADNKNNYGL